PQHLAFDGSGNLYVTNGNSNTITKIAPDGTASRFIQFFDVSGLSFDTAGNLYVSRFFAHNIAKFDPNGNFLGGFAGVGNPTGQARDDQGSIYVTDPSANRVSRVTSDGSVYFFSN